MSVPGLPDAVLFACALNRTRSPTAAALMRDHLDRRIVERFGPGGRAAEA